MVSLERQGINSPQTAAKHQHGECQRSEFIIDVVFKGNPEGMFSPLETAEKRGFGEFLSSYV